jgi:hypothetical protein
MGQGDRLDLIERDGPEPERLPTGTWLHDLGCPHCGKTCDVCVVLDANAAEDRQRLRGAVSLTDFERDSLTTLLSGIVNDGLDTYGGVRVPTRARVVRGDLDRVVPDHDVPG